MNFALLALIAVLRVAGASSAGNTGTLTTITTDTVALPASGGEWATVQFTALSAGTSTVTSQISVDGGNNWIASAFAKRLSTVNANPTVQAISATTLVAADVWEVPLPSNATHFRLLCAGTGTTTTVQINGGQPYVPGTQVAAILYDTTVTAGGANNTGTLDGSGWTSLSWDLVVATATTGALSVNDVDDAGSAIAIASVASLTTGTYAGGLGVGVSMGTAITPITGLTQVALPKRFNFALAGATTSSIRLRVRVSR